MLWMNMQTKPIENLVFAESEDFLDDRTFLHGCDSCCGRCAGRRYRWLTILFQAQLLQTSQIQFIFWHRLRLGYFRLGWWRRWRCNSILSCGQYGARVILMSIEFATKILRWTTVEQEARAVNLYETEEIRPEFSSWKYRWEICHSWLTLSSKTKTSHDSVWQQDCAHSVCEIISLVPKYFAPIFTDSSERMIMSCLTSKWPIRNNWQKHVQEEFFISH